jgi:PAS domain S-box-containing protein
VDYKTQFGHPAQASGGQVLGLFQRLTRSSLVPHLAARKELEAELARGHAAEAELQKAYKSLEERIAQRAEELARANEGLAKEMGRCKDAEARFAAISESVPYGAWIFRLDGTAELVSSLYLELTGVPAEELRQRPWFELIQEDDRERVSALWSAAVSEGHVWDAEFRVVGRDGDVRHLLSRGAPLRSEDGKVRAYAGFQLDVTERVKLRNELVRLKCELEEQVATKTEELREANRHLVLDLADRIKAEIALRDNETQLRAMFENALDGMLLLDDHRRVLDANGSALQLFNYSLTDIRQKRWDALVPPERLPGIDERWTAFLSGGTKRGEVDVRQANGNSRLVAFSSRANIMPGRHLITIRDITDHREAEDSLRLLSHRLMKLQDDERRRIARELHDSTGQSLAAMRMHLDSIAACGSELPEKAKKALGEAEEICRSCIKDIRTISYLLHPPLLDEVGLLPALEWYITGFSERSGLRVTTEIREPENALAKELNTALFRIIQEALANIHKHSGSQEATIRLEADGDHVVLEISDRGRGIDAQRLEARRPGVKGLGVGLTGMRERVSQLGGKLEILAANPGTLIRAILPKPTAFDHTNGQ